MVYHRLSQREAACLAGSYPADHVGNADEIGVDPLTVRQFAPATRLVRAGSRWQAAPALLQIDPRVLREELANSLTHGFGLAASLVGAIGLVWLATSRGTGWHIAGCGIYAASLVFVYAASTIYHSVHRPHVKQRMRTLDHAGIYLFIAGSYTPFMLTLLRGAWGWSLLAAVWTMAALGIAMRMSRSERLEALSAFPYLLMGWLAVVAAKPVIAVLSVSGLAWIVMGGLFYTVGVYFFLKDHRPFHHAIWHLFVLGGSLCHFLAILFHVIPPLAA